MSVISSIKQGGFLGFIIGKTGFGLNLRSEALT